MNIMMDSQYNSRLEQPRRRILTAESLPIASDIKMYGLRPLEPLFTAISNTCITRSSNTFSIPDRSHHSHVKEMQPSKCRAAKALFSKHKKRLESAQKEKRSSTSSECSILPSGFSCILKTRSTLIRQNRLQQYYVNLTEEAPQIYVQEPIDNPKSNFFKPNFIKKKTKLKRKSELIEKSIKTTASNDYSKENAVVMKKLDAYYQSQDDNLILRERILMNNKKMADQKKPKMKQRGVVMKKMQIHEQKQNSEFNLEPWAIQSDDFVISH